MMGERQRKGHGHGLARREMFAFGHFQSVVSPTASARLLRNFDFIFSASPLLPVFLILLLNLAHREPQCHARHFA